MITDGDVMNIRVMITLKEFRSENADIFTDKLTLLEPEGLMELRVAR